VLLQTIDLSRNLPESADAQESALRYERRRRKRKRRTLELKEAERLGIWE